MKLMKTKNQRTKDFAVMICLLVAVAGSGCAHVTGGTGIHADSVAFIKPGATTKAEVIENLGQPTWEAPSERVISYLWETTDGVNGDFFGRHCEFGDDPTQHAFCIALDESNRVARAGFAKGKDFAELKKTIAAWSGSAPELLANGTGQPRPLITAPAPLSGGRIALAYSGEVAQFDLQIADTKSE